MRNFVEGLLECLSGVAGVLLRKKLPDTSAQRQFSTREGRRRFYLDRTHRQTPPIRSGKLLLLAKGVELPDVPASSAECR